MNTISHHHHSASASSHFERTDGAPKNRHCGASSDSQKSSLENGPPSADTAASDSDLGTIADKFSEVINNLIASFERTIQKFMDLLSDKSGSADSTTGDTSGSTPTDDSGETNGTDGDDSETGNTPDPGDASPGDSTTDTEKSGDCGSTPSTDNADSTKNEQDCGSETDEKTKKLNKTGDFLYRPRSEKDGNLVVLLPPRLSKAAASVRIVDKDGKVLAAGVFSGIANGDRAHFRFNRPGGKFPDGSFVEITRKNGTVIKQEIAETSKEFRY